MSEESIRVYARVRPCADASDDFLGIVQDELDPTKLRLSLPAGATSGNSTQPAHYQFAFDQVFWKESRQEDMFSIVALPLLSHSLDGYNSTLFAYGQTGSGKTFTITGDGTRLLAGVVPRAIQHVYDTLQDNPSDRVEVSISYLEIYNNIAYDLLTQIGTSQVQKLEDLRRVTIADTGKSTVFKDLLVAPAKTLEDAHRLFWSGECVRQKAETINNKYSSRSHTIFTFYFTRRSGTSVVASRINFVDLAGSEKYETLSKEVDARKLEARHINKSLHTLQGVIIGINQRQKHIPFRDAVLTRFLKDSLVGNVRTAMIATISTHRNHLTETISTCRFSESVASVTLTVRLSQQELPPHEVIARLREEVARLRDELSRSGGGGSAPASRVTEADTLELQKQVIRFVEDPAATSLDVTGPAQVQFCFGFMKDLLNRGDKAALRVSKLQGDLDKAKKQLEQFVRMISIRDKSRADGDSTITKEATYLEFCNSHEKAKVLQDLRDAFKAKCQDAKQLNDEGGVLRQERDELQEELATLQRRIQALDEGVSQAPDRGPLEKELQDLRAKHAKMNAQWEQAQRQCEDNSRSLKECKDEVLRLQTQLGETRECVHQDFQQFWMTVMSHSPGKAIQSSKPPKRPPQSHMNTSKPWARPGPL